MASIETATKVDQVETDGVIIEEIRQYWNEHIHDLEITKHPVGTKEFFHELYEYRFEKLHYLEKIVDFDSYQGKYLLEVGCGVGIDLIRFAKGAAIVTGIDLAETSIELAKRNFELNGVKGDLKAMNGEDLEFEDDSFDIVYAHGVLQYTYDARRMIKEIHRVLKPRGQAIMMVYNKYSWLNFLSKMMKVDLEHEDAPVLNKYSISKFKDMLSMFSKVEIIPERFPVKTRLHHGVKAFLYNRIFVVLFNALPHPLIRPLGWHLMARTLK